jgi:hypothetical protein
MAAGSGNVTTVQVPPISRTETIAVTGSKADNEG